MNALDIDCPLVADILCGFVRDEITKFGFDRGIALRLGIFAHVQKSSGYPINLPSDWAVKSTMGTTRA